MEASNVAFLGKLSRRNANANKSQNKLTQMKKELTQSYIQLGIQIKEQKKVGQYEEEENNNQVINTETIPYVGIDLLKKFTKIFGLNPYDLN